ncbi:MAG: hypothetical protein ACE5F6_00140 [Anaerolineae bacterium]
MPENLPLQKRTGFNRGEQSVNLNRIRHLGQPAIKAGPGDTVILKNAPVIPGRGQKTPRTQIMNLTVGGYVFNRTGNNIDYDFILVDPDGKEFAYHAEDLGVGSWPLPNDENHPIPSLGYLAYYARSNTGIPLSLLLPGWSLVLRVKSGNPLSGRGLIIWAWANDMSNNLQALMVPVTKTEIELGPDPGRAWQLCGSNLLQGLPLTPTYLNFDSVVRTVEQGAEIYRLAGEDIQVNNLRPDIAVDPRTDANTGVEAGFLTEIGDQKKPNGLVLSCPDKIKVKAKENQTSGPLYLLVPFAEFDLPADMQVEEE